MAGDETPAVDSCVTTSGLAGISVAEALQLADLAKVLSDPIRLRLLTALASAPAKEACVCDLQEVAPEVSQPTISHHLRILKNAELVSSQRRGTWVWYQLGDRRQELLWQVLAAFAALADNACRREDRSLAAFRGADHDQLLQRIATELAVEFEPISTEMVLACVRDSYASLAQSSSISAHLPQLAARFARQRLADLRKHWSMAFVQQSAGQSQPHDPAWSVEDTPVAAQQLPPLQAIPQVLFLCIENAGRSQLAAAWLRRLSGGRVIVRTAGSKPAGAIHPLVLEQMAAISGGSVVEEFPKPLTNEAVRAADVVVSMGCGDVCPRWPGVLYEDWPVADPSMATDSEIERISHDIEQRVRELLTKLGLAVVTEPSIN